MPHELCQIGRNVAITRAMHTLKFVLGAFPHVFNRVGVDTSTGIHKVQRMVHCSMWKPGDWCQLAVRRPLVTPDSCSWKNMLLDDGQQCGSVAAIDLHEEGLVGGFVDAAEHPALTELSGLSVTCGFGGRHGALVDLDDVPWTANLSRVCTDPVDAQVAVHVKPVRQRALCVDVQPRSDRRLTDVVVRPEKRYLQ